MSLPWVDLPADSIEMRSEAASRRRRYSTTLGQGASLRSAPTLWPRKLSGETGPAARAGAGTDSMDRTDRLSVSTYGRGQRGIGVLPSVTPESTVGAALCGRPVLHAAALFPTRRAAT